MTYRRDLEAAHARIAFLEATLAERTHPSLPKIEPADTGAESPPEDERVRWWDAWPVAMIPLLAILYALPSSDPLSRGSLALGVAGSVILLLRLLVQLATGRRCSRLTRALLVLGVLVGLPFLAPVVGGLGAFGATVSYLALLSGLLVGGPPGVAIWIWTGEFWV